MRLEELSQEGPLKQQEKGPLSWGPRVSMDSCGAHRAEAAQRHARRVPAGVHAHRKGPMRSGPRAQREVRALPGSARGKPVTT